MKGFLKLLTVSLFAVMFITAGITGAYADPINPADAPNFGAQVFGRSITVQYSAFYYGTGEWGKQTISANLDPAVPLDGALSIESVSGQPACTIGGWMFLDNMYLSFDGEDALLYNGKSLAGQTRCAMYIPLNPAINIASNGAITGTGSVLVLSCVAEVRVNGSGGDINSATEGVMKLKISVASARVVQYNADINVGGTDTKAKVKIAALKFGKN